MMISFDNGRDRFQFRAAGIVIHDRKVLMQKAEGDDVWFIPGGRVEFHETAESAIEREMAEEFAVRIRAKRLVWIVENFVSFPDRQVHEIGMFYLVDLPEGHPIYIAEGKFAGVENGFVNRWIDMDDLDHYRIVPEFVIPELKALHLIEGIKHVKSYGSRK